MAARPLAQEDLALSRRGLLAAAAAGGVALALPVSDAYAASGGKLRVGIVGGGTSRARAACLRTSPTTHPTGRS